MTVSLLLVFLMEQSDYMTYEHMNSKSISLVFSLIVFASLKNFVHTVVSLHDVIGTIMSKHRVFTS